ncbi:alpha/beta hydrolase family protein [Embleya sp. NBC_00896]|uniref:alpha/beta hydrolase family protein n=1 Tax=Embleya sp. NBC_00896 TaxID=2975961 RepID=UPI00386858CF|nr:alpha/beta fold hydrolase [Embleya sp. NBC_00896]
MRLGPVIRRHRRLTIGAAIVAMLLIVGLGAAVYADYANQYDIKEERIAFQDGAQRLDGVLAKPTNGRGPYGLVLLVHGDGPKNATNDGFYRPQMEAYARAGFATLSWNKPGIDGTPGDWLDQSMEDRARETEAAIAWSRSRPDVDHARVGLWGASQAGWVLPKVAARTPDVKFLIAVSPAINWLRQGRFNLLAELRADHASAARIDEAVRRSDATRALIARGASHAEYRAALGDGADMAANRWDFVRRNFTADASEDLARVRVPVLLMLAGHDVNVDVAETETEYRRLLGGHAELTVTHYPGATHSMVGKSIEDSTLKTYFTAIFAPRELLVAGYLGDQRRFLQGH